MPHPNKLSHTEAMDANELINTDRDSLAATARDVKLLNRNKVTGVNVHKITASIIEPTNPNIGDLWIQLDALLSPPALP